MTQRCRPKHREEQVWSKLVVRANGVEPTLHRALVLTRGATGDCYLLGLPAGSRHFLPSLLHSLTDAREEEVVLVERVNSNPLVLWP